MDRLSDVMVRNVVKVRPKDNLLQVQGFLQKYEVSRVLVTDDAKPLGIITRKDVIRYLLEDTSDRNLDQIRSAEVMTKNLVTLPDSATVANSASLMIENGISSIIVVNQQGKLAGLVTKTDICLYYGSRAWGLHKVREWMTRNPVYVKGATSIFKVAALMQQHKISRVLVQNTKLEGIVTVSDLVAANVVFNPKRAIDAKKPIFIKGMIVRPTTIILISARDVMTANPVTVGIDDDLASAAKLMTTHGISGFPVVDKKGRLAGVVTKTDIARAVAKMT